MIKSKHVVTALVLLVASAAQMQAATLPLAFPVVAGTTLPDFTPAQLTAMGMPQCYPFCFPPAPRITGVVTPSGGKGVQLPGPVTPWIFKLVIKAGLPTIETIRAGFKTTFTPVPPQFLAAPIQPAAVQTPPVPATVVTPAVKAGGKGTVVKVGGGPGYAVPGEVVPPQSGKGKDDNAQAEKQLNANEVEEMQPEAMEKGGQGMDMESRGHDKDQSMEGSQEDHHGMDGVRDQDQRGRSSGDNRGSTDGGSNSGSGSSGNGSNNGGGSNSGGGANGGDHGGGSNGGHGGGSNGGGHGGR